MSSRALPNEREVDQLVDSGEKQQKHFAATGKTKTHGEPRRSSFLPFEKQKKRGKKKKEKTIVVPVFYRRKDNVSNK